MTTGDTPITMVFAHKRIGFLPEKSKESYFHPVSDEEAKLVEGTFACCAESIRAWSQAYIKKWNELECACATTPFASIKCMRYSLVAPPEWVERMRGLSFD